MATTESQVVYEHRLIKFSAIEIMGTDSELSQMGSAKVRLIERQGQRYIQKQGVNEIERGFYFTAAKVLSERGVHSPSLVHAEGDSIVIEYIPHAVTLEELTSSSQVYTQIAAIHQTPIDLDWALKQHSWSDNALRTAFQLLSLSSQEQNVLKKLQSQSHIIFDCPTLLSGDTNDGNWGRRENGELVLFDWERFSTGSPAIDLVPLIKGLGDEEAMLRTVDSYMNVHKAMPREELFRHVIIAKAWIVVEVTNLLYERQKPQLQKHLDWFNANLPRWIRGVEALV
ncbi:phosphotransferase family protein [Vibrio coralliilyticus]|nr:hypothetical protein [Vibrio coralliilyticus]